MAMSLAVGLVGGVVEGSLLVTSATSGALLGVFLLAAMVPAANGRGALCGMLASHCITAWMAVGRLLYVDDSVAMLPLSVERCANATLQLPRVPVPVAANASLALLAPTLHALRAARAPAAAFAPQSATPALLRLYSVSYMWYAVIGTLICVVVGAVVGALTASERDAFDEKLLHPMVARLARKMPGKRRRFTSPEEAPVEATAEESSGSSPRASGSPMMLRTRL